MRFSNITHKHTFFVLLAIACILLTLGLTTQTSRSVTGTSCSSDFTVLGGSTTGLFGVINLKLAAPSGSTVPISKVVFRANGKPIGKAQPTSTYTWTMPWDTSLYPAGSVTVDAEVYLEGHTEYCAAVGFTGYVSANQPTSSLELFTDPKSWEGPQSYGFPVHAILKSSNTTVDLNKYALYSWQTSIGALSDIRDNDAQFSTGNNEGSGKITVRANYGGKVAIAYIPVSVKSLNSPLPETNDDSTSVKTSDDSSGSVSDSGTATTSTTTDSSTTTTTASNDTTKTTTQATLQNNPAAQNCVVDAIGKARYEVINSGKARPTIEEIQKFKACFASSNYILPNNFAPVEPAKVKELNRTGAVKIENPSNTTIKNDDETEKEVLVFRGTAEPDSTVLIYVFSNPLVLTTTANANGEWTYMLEDPIEPGDHEVYTVVDRGNGVYERSDPIAFSIVGTAEAAALESNPSGLSLRLADQVTPTKSNRSLVLYALASVGTLVVAGAVVLLSLRTRHNKNNLLATAAPDQSMATPVEPSSASEQPAEEGAVPIEMIAPAEPATIQITTEPQTLSGEETSKPELRPEPNTPENSEDETPKDAQST